MNGCPASDTTCPLRGWVAAFIDDLCVTLGLHINPDQ
jgi:hypothetical protein